MNKKIINYNKFLSYESNKLKMENFFLHDLAKQLKTILTPQVIYKLKQFVHLILMVFGLFFVFQGAFPGQKQKIENRQAYTQQTNSEHKLASYY